MIHGQKNIKAKKITAIYISMNLFWEQKNCNCFCSKINW